MEAAARTAQHLLREADPERTADTAPPTIDFHPIRGVARGIKEAEVEGIGRVAVCNGIAAGMELLAQPDWKQRYVAVEVTACVGGCLGGGGEPKSMDPHVLSKRAAAIYAIDAKQEKRRSDQNAEVQQLYIDHLGGASGSGRAHDLLHTDYAERRSPRSALARFLAAVDARDGAAAAALFVFDEGCEWDTGTTALGKLVGRRDIEACVNTELPPTSPTAPSIRHRLVDRAEGLDVRTPTGELCTFDVALDPVTRLIQSLRRRPDCVSR
jgi:NADH-quinone oxidoreductase subunit G